MKKSCAKFKVKIMEGDKIIEREIMVADTKTIFESLLEDNAHTKRRAT